jgi:hypothetical protein
MREHVIATYYSITGKFGDKIEMAAKDNREHCTISNTERASSV